jgi:hypothetical protein
MPTIRRRKRAKTPMDPVQQAVDICFNASSFTVLTAATSTLVGTISTLFGMLMLSYRSRIQSAEQREREANQQREEAIQDRNEALWRLETARTEYLHFVEETQATLPRSRSRSRLPAPGHRPSDPPRGGLR